MPGAEITLFTTAFQAIGYLSMMAVANLCYFAGPLSESLVNPTNMTAIVALHICLGFVFQYCCRSVFLPSGLVLPPPSLQHCQAVARQLMNIAISPTTGKQTVPGKVVGVIACFRHSFADARRKYRILPCIAA